MRFFVLFVSLILALPAAAQQACSNFELVGFTSATYTGPTGVLGFTTACQAEFTDSRMCTSVEVMQTVNLPISLTGDAWVRPVFVPNGGLPDALEASGLQQRGESLTCGAWAGGSFSTALSVSANGGFAVGAINCQATKLAVACCAAAPSSTMAAIVPFTSPVGRMVLGIAMLSAVGVYWTRRGAVAEVV